MHMDCVFCAASPSLRSTRCSCPTERRSPIALPARKKRSICEGPMRASDERIVDASRPREAFSCEVGWVGHRTLSIAYVGSIPAGDAHARRIEQMVLSSDERVGLYYDLRELRGFHRTQVELHARTLARIAGRVTGIALAGARPTARFGAVTVSLVS